MNKKFLWKLLITLGFVFNAQVSFAAGDAEEGKVKFFTCGGCHGIEGYTNAVPNYPVPRIGGQHADSIIAALRDYQDGSRKHGSMEGNASGWSDDDLDDLSAYISRKVLKTERNPITGNVKSGKEKSATCAGCHGEDGNSTTASFPRLAGQYEAYLVKALTDYKKGHRVNPIMKGMAEGLSAKDILDISAFYASQQRGLTTVSE